MIAGVGTWLFPQALPPFQFVVVLVGGQPGTIYRTRYRVTGPKGTEIAKGAGADVPFTTQIKRANLYQNIQQISADPIVTEPGVYTFEFYVRDELVASTPLAIERTAPPANPAPSSPSP